MLCKVVIVDDEWIIRRSIATTIQEVFPDGFEIVGMASNGVEGMEIIRSLQPDIVITDVKMPLMDGIEMVKHFKESEHSFACVFMSGFDEFSYVKQAIDLDAEKYLLKPINTQELTEVLRRIKRQKEQEAVLSCQLEKASRALQASHIARLLTAGQRFGGVSPEEMQNLKKQMPYERYCVLTILPDNGPPDRYGNSGIEPYLLKYAVYNIVEELFSAQWPALFYYSDERWFAAILNLHNDEDAQKSISLCCENISAQVQKHFSAFVTVGVGDDCTALDSCAVSFQEATEALEYRDLYGKGAIIFYSSLPESNQKDDGFDFTKYQKELIYAVKMGNQPQIEAVLAEIRQMLVVNSGKALTQSKTVATALLMVVLKEIGEWQMDTEVLQQRFSVVVRKIQSFETLQEVYEKFRVEILILAETVSENQNNQQKKIIAKAKEYIDSHYMNQKLPLQEVAAQVHVSATYLSILFKRECGENFIDYVTALRMEKAQELLRTTDDTTIDIARRVGYANAQYFGLCFKKHFGCSPGQFRVSGAKAPAEPQPIKRTIK
ncbi:MAG: response regulator [Ruthenibacterium sp.]